MIEIKHEVSLRQQLELTPQLIQALRLLQLTRLELEQELKTELEINPFLEEEQSEQETLDTEVEENIYNDRSAAGSGDRGIVKREEDPIENTAHREMGLHDYLLWQLGLSANTELEIQIGEAIIGNINDEGYLSSPVEDIVSFTGSPAEDVERVLGKIQDFDPSGVGARSLKECLQIQIRHLGIDNPIINGILADHLNDLEKKDYSSIAKALGVQADLVTAAAEIIKHLNPKPGNMYSSGEENYIVPDVMVTKIGERLVVELIEEGVPRIKAADYYARKLLDQTGANDTAKKFIREKLQGARWLIKAVEQRKNTIKKVVEAIVERQKSFFEYGEQYFEPMVLKDIALDIGVHETTVGRVTNGKYVQTQWGIYELKYFFSPSLKTDNGDLLSTKLVKQKIKELIDKESQSAPLSDTDIVRILKTEGINIARRTVAKYREIMNISPLHIRRVKVS
ncbi:MAG: RNA polymerase factor sigma-54 [Deltaproteobacteria bacterium]|nr:RNA polymerase factor sigma-54 [Deltaproteobacteria bacterium]